MTAKRYTKQQLELVEELCKTHGLSPEQISFEGTELSPIFDYEANSLLSLRLSDIASLDCSFILRAGGRSPCQCRVELPDGRERTVSDSAEIGESMYDGSTIESVRQADSLARARAARLGIRSVGVNLYNAHKRFKLTGQLAVAHTDESPRAAALRELHVLAAEVGLISGSDRSRYEAFLAESFDGRTTSTDLNDLDFHRLISQLRARARPARSNSKGRAGRLPGTACITAPGGAVLSYSPPGLRRGGSRFG